MKVKIICIMCNVEFIGEQEIHAVLIVGNGRSRGILIEDNDFRTLQNALKYSGWR